MSYKKSLKIPHTNPTKFLLKISRFSPPHDDQRETCSNLSTRPNGDTTKPHRFPVVVPMGTEIPKGDPMVTVWITMRMHDIPIDGGKSGFL